MQLEWKQTTSTTAKKKDLFPLDFFEKIYGSKLDCELFLFYKKK